MKLKEVEENKQRQLRKIATRNQSYAERVMAKHEQIREQEREEEWKKLEKLAEKERRQGKTKKGAKRKSESIEGEETKQEIKKRVQINI